MPGGDFQRVTRNDRLVIPADAYNAMLDAAEAERGQRFRGGALPATGFGQTGIIKVRNDTGSAVARFHVLALDEPIILPSANEDEFKRQVAFACVEPTTAHEGLWVVLLEPLADGAIGRAVVSGATVARLQVDTDNSDDRVEVENGETVLLLGSAGTGQLLWREGGTGEQWAVVRVGLDLDLDEKAKVSSNDTTAGYLNGKLVPGTGISLTENNDGGNETLTIANTASTGGYPTFSGCVATRTSQTISDSTETDVLFDTEVEDTDGYHSTVTNTQRFTVPAAGRYFVRAYAAFAGSATGYRYIAIYHSAHGINAVTQVGNTGASDSVAIEVSTRSQAVSAGSYFYVTVEQTSGGDLQMTVARLEIHRIE